MKLYEATNGYLGESYVRCLVIAPDDETAMRLARKRYSEYRQVVAYTKNIELEIICDDTSKEWSTKVTDG